MSLERIQIIGNIVRFEQRRAGNGMEYATMDVAVDRWKGNDKHTTYYRCLMFNGIYESAMRIANKFWVGRQVHVEGRPEVAIVSKAGEPRVEFTILTAAVPELLGYGTDPRAAAPQAR